MTTCRGWGLAIGISWRVFPSAGGESRLASVPKIVWLPGCASALRVFVVAFMHSSKLSNRDLVGISDRISFALQMKPWRRFADFWSLLQISEANGLNSSMSSENNILGGLGHIVWVVTDGYVGGESTGGRGVCCCTTVVRSGSSFVGGWVGLLHGWQVGRWLPPMPNMFLYKSHLTTIAYPTSPRWICHHLLDHDGIVCPRWRNEVWCINH